MNRTKNAARNMVFGLLLNIYKILIPFVVRTVMIWKLGEEYTGLNGLFSSLLQILNLAELGVGYAMDYSLYLPVAERDGKKICALLNMYRRYYRYIGLFILTAGVALTPSIPRLIHGDLPEDLNLYVLYLMSLASTVLSYWLFTYKNSLLTAHQRVDISSKLEIGSKTVQLLLQLFVLIVLENYYLFLAADIFAKLLLNLMTGWITARLYPSYKPRGELPAEEKNKVNCRVRDLFTARFAGKVTAEADTIVITAFLGLVLLARYQNYFLIMSAVCMVIDVIFSSVRSGLGNSLILESEEKNYQQFRTFTFLFLWLLSAATPCFLCLYQPFIRIWLGDQALMPMTLVWCLTLYFFVVEVNHLLNTYKDAAGFWKVDKWRPLTAALVNVGLNLLTVRIWGLYGVVLSTVAAFAGVEIPWLLRNLFRYLFAPFRRREYIRELLSYVLTVSVGTVACGWVSRLLCEHIEGAALQFLAGAGLCLLLPGLIFAVRYHRKRVFKDSLLYLRKLCLGK